jgi:uncharacterized repeat protein (TIGR01451 family)
MRACSFVVCAWLGATSVVHAAPNPDYDPHWLAGDTWRVQYAVSLVRQLKERRPLEVVPTAVTYTYRVLSVDPPGSTRLAKIEVRPDEGGYPRWRLTFDVNAMVLQTAEEVVEGADPVKFSNPFGSDSLMASPDDFDRLIIHDFPKIPTADEQRTVQPSSGSGASPFLQKVTLGADSMTATFERTDPVENAPHQTTIQWQKGKKWWSSATVTLGGEVQVSGQLLAQEALPADLRITKKAPAQVVAGVDFDYLITVANAGPDKASSVLISDQLPAGVQFKSAQVSPGGASSGTGNQRQVAFPAISVGATAEVKFTVAPLCSVPDRSGLSNAVQVGSSTRDPNTADNTASVASQVSNPSPTLSRVTAKPSSLTATNKLVDVTIEYTHGSHCDTCTLSVKVTKEGKGGDDDDERHGQHAGASGPDFEIVDDHHVRLRAERKNRYLVTVTCVDPLGRSVSGSVKVKVKKK